MERTIKVVAADDDADDFDFLRSAFVQLLPHIVIVHTEDGCQLLSYLRSCCKSNELPDIIVLDLNMPKVDGLTALKAIKSDPDLKDIHVFIHTTCSGYDQKLASMNEGASGFFTKGCNFSVVQSFAASILEFCERSHQHSL
jgi:CheY-like chemotaxis protein